ncbi:MAG: hypothetical protein QG635_2240 [Bacteroidota bacterium]|nr:hypothetical protein [Bacteroidota bacterium]
MDEERKENISGDEEQVFSQRLDFYWQSTGIYAVILIVYSVMRGSFESHYLDFVILDPIVILLSLFIIVSSISMLIMYYKSLSITISGHSLIFKSRFREKKYSETDIQRIVISNERRFKSRKKLRIIKIKLMRRKRMMKIRPSSFINEDLLVATFAGLKKSLNK